MNLNPFLAALGGAFRGAAMDTEMRRRLEEAEQERKRQKQIDKQNAIIANNALRSSLEQRGYKLLSDVPTAQPSQDGLPASPLDAVFAQIASKRYTNPTEDLDGNKFVLDTMNTPEMRSQQKAQSENLFELEKYSREQEAKAQAESEIFDRKNRGAHAVLSRPKGPLDGIPYDQVKDQDLSAALRDYMASQSQDAAFQRAIAIRSKNDSDANSRKPKERALPASVVEKIGAYDALDTMTQEVKSALDAAIKAKQDITGRVGGVVSTPSWWKNTAPTFIGGKPAYRDTEGRDIGADTRAMMGNLYATLAKERGGTALSANEIRLLESYLPNENEDEAMASLKAGRFLKELRRLKAAKLSAYQKYGFGVDDNLPMGDQPIGKRPTANDLWENP